MSVEFNPKAITLNDQQHCYYYSQLMDQMAERVFNELKSQLVLTQEHIDRVRVLSDQPVNCGATPPDVHNPYDLKVYANCLLEGASPFEQMIALEEWLTTQPRPLQQKHTFCLMNATPRHQGKAVPIAVQKTAQSLMQVVIGNNSFANAAPRYENDWDTVDPWLEPRREKFIYHLEALEMVRQPESLGASLIKGNAFESDFIDPDWRYGTNGREASVEFKQQKRLNSQRQAIKAQSAAFNLFQLINQGLGDIDLNNHRDPGIEDFWDLEEDIPEYATLEVTPNTLWQALHSQEEHKLYHQMFKLMVAKIGPQTTPALKKCIKTHLTQASFELSADSINIH